MSFLFFISYQKQNTSPEQKKANAYVPDSSEYQLVIEDDSIIISDFGRHVTTIHLDSAGQIGIELIKDNE